ncbi:unnamed protein product [Bemisia tabaci]|uniref:t-SNARE coiled-coil homology domain-containing protein n=1 Tax=Bemisia tabaci TaxID=7038 RepID=A0A9P0A8R8_BEMTA|nr:PREDICTED: syntaxin-8 [Bemisia tabaci]CAH0388029.1 unnamed protein product [Bemisia tabaci]
MALLNIDNDPWLNEHATCERFHQTISEQLHLRTLETRDSENYARMSASIRLRLKQFAAEVDELKQKLELANASKPITSQEYERRLRLIENLKSKHIQMVERFNHRAKPVTSAYSQDRSSLLNNQMVADGGVTGWGIDDDDDDRPNRPLLAQSSEWTIDDLRAQQRRIVEVQDEGLENLSKVISRQKEIVVSINSEVDLHNEVIDDIAVKMDRATSSSHRETEQIGVILRKDSTWGYWLIILTLFFAIVVVAML